MARGRKRVGKFRVILSNRYLSTSAEPVEDKGMVLCITTTNHDTNNW